METATVASHTHSLPPTDPPTLRRTRRRLSLVGSFLWHAHSISRNELQSCNPCWSPQVLVSDLTKLKPQSEQAEWARCIAPTTPALISP